MPFQEPGTRRARAQGLNELEISLESTEKAARMVGVSPECMEKFNHLFELYEEKTED